MLGINWGRRRLRRERRVPPGQGCRRPWGWGKRSASGNRGGDAFPRSCSSSRRCLLLFLASCRLLVLLPRPLFPTSLRLALPGGSFTHGVTVRSGCRGSALAELGVSVEHILMPRAPQLGQEYEFSNRLSWAVSLMGRLRVGPLPPPAHRTPFL